MKKGTVTALKKNLKESAFEAILIVFVLFGSFWLALPDNVKADTESTLTAEALMLKIETAQNAFKENGTLPVADLREPQYYMSIPVTAYNSVPWQTDDTPCIGAQGTDICQYLEAGSNTCAANFVPLGTVLEVEGLGTCVVRDRMNARYYYRVDWYMGNDITAARIFGLQIKDVGIYAS